MVLALYGALLWLLCLRTLPETHPPEARTSVPAGPLFRIYKAIAADGVSAARRGDGLNFGAFFLYIISAPAFSNGCWAGTLDFPVLRTVHRRMSLGAALSPPTRRTSRAARHGTLGYAIMVTATLANGLQLFHRPHYGAVGRAARRVEFRRHIAGLSDAVAEMLDRYPRDRGSASSCRVLWCHDDDRDSRAALALALVAWHRARAGRSGADDLRLGCWLWYAHLTPAEPRRRSHPRLEEPVEPA